MKNIVSCFFLAAALLTTASFAHGDKACKPVWKACKAGGKKGKAARACVATIKGGGTVDGVTVAEADLAACQGKSAPAAAEAPAPTPETTPAPAPTAN